MREEVALKRKIIKSLLIKSSQESMTAFNYLFKTDKHKLFLLVKYVANVPKLPEYLIKEP